MSNKSEKLTQITQSLASLLDLNAVDSLRVEMISQGKRIVLVTDSNMLTPAELAMRTGKTNQPKLKLVRG